MKRYEIIADVTFYTDDDRKLCGKLISGVDANNLLSALKWFDSEVEDKKELLDAYSYFVVPLYIGCNQSAISKKYYRDVVINYHDLWVSWCC